jgi:hypothetical protein
MPRWTGGHFLRTPSWHRRRADELEPSHPELAQDHRNVAKLIEGRARTERRHLRVYRQPAIEPLIQSDHSLSCCCSVARSLFDVDRAAHAHSHRTPPACSERSSRTSQMPAIANTEHYEIRRLVRRRHRSCRHRTRQNRHCARPAVQCRMIKRPGRPEPGLAEWLSNP